MPLLFYLLIFAAVQDIRSGKISNRLIAIGLMMGLLFQIMEHKVCGVYYFLWNVSVPVILLYLLFQMRVLGAGDIKLFSMIGSLLTFQELCRCMFYAFFIAGAGCILFLAADKRRRQRVCYAVQYLFLLLHTGRIKPYEPPYESEQLSFAFSIPVLAGTIFALFF